MPVYAKSSADIDVDEMYQVSYTQVHLHNTMVVFEVLTDVV